MSQIIDAGNRVIGNKTNKIDSSFLSDRVAVQPAADDGIVKRGSVGCEKERQQQCRACHDRFVFCFHTV